MRKAAFSKGKNKGRVRCRDEQQHTKTGGASMEATRVKMGAKQV